MTTKVEPTVEKWERDFDDDIYIPCSSSCASSTHPFADCNCEAPKIKREIKTRIHTILAHSVQEAKAERDREIVEKVKSGVLSYLDINHIFTVGSSLSTKDRADLVDSLVIKSLLATLNTKEEV